MELPTVKMSTEKHKKHKKHKSEKRDRYDDRPFCLERPPSLKLILKVGGTSNSTPEYASSESPVDLIYGIQPDSLGLTGEYPERHKKSKKKKKKKDREKKHKHHKEKRRERATENESSQEDFSINEDSAQFQSDSTIKYHQILGDSSNPALEAFTPLSLPMVSEESPSMSVLSDNMKSPMSTSDSGREPRACVMKKQGGNRLAKLLHTLLPMLEKNDPKKYFELPVSDELAPGYSSIILKPMDFLTMRQKIDDNQYTSLTEFIDDFKLMCDNATLYNYPGTVFHKCAKKLWHVGKKILGAENLLRLKSLRADIDSLTPEELGFDVRKSFQLENDLQNIDLADESMVCEEMSMAQFEEDMKRQTIRLENEPKTKFEPFIDDSMAEEILAQVQNAALKAHSKLSERKRAAKMGFLRQRHDGTTSMQVLVGANNTCPERVVSLGTLTGKIQNGSGQLHSFREDRRNTAKIVKPLNYGTFSSFAPVYDSRFANLNKEETDLVLQTYGNESSADYAASVVEFTKDSQTGCELANSLLDFLTDGEHQKTLTTLMDNARHKYEKKQLELKYPDPVNNDDDDDKHKEISIDFDNLRSLAQIGVNMDFLGDMEDEYKMLEICKTIQKKLENNSDLLDELNRVQNDRLSQNLPMHLANISHPNDDELDLADQITTNLTEIAKDLPPHAVTTPHALRKAMGLSNVGLEPLDRSNQSASSIDEHDEIADKLQDARDVLPMDIDLDQHDGDDLLSNDVSDVPHVDLESELRDFLENDSTTLAAADDVTSIDQILMS